MSDTQITERQQYWLDHIRAAVAFDGSIADYARFEGLKPKELYSWKGLVVHRGLLSVPTADENSGGFVRVITPARPLGMTCQQYRFQVFGREGLACYECDQTIERLTMRRRNILVCPQCQSF
ncbi:MAG: hypothetical protein WBN09_02095 [Woeseiaceae bacterium]